MALELKDDRYFTYGVRADVPLQVGNRIVVIVNTDLVKNRLVAKWKRAQPSFRFATYGFRVKSLHPKNVK